MGLIREAMSGPWLSPPDDGQDIGCTLHLLNGSHVALGVSYRKVSRMLLGARSPFGPPSGLTYEERRGWLQIAPPASDGEVIVPVTAIAAIVPGLPEPPVDDGDQDLDELDLELDDADPR